MLPRCAPEFVEAEHASSYIAIQSQSKPLLSNRGSYVLTDAPCFTHDSKFHYENLLLF